MPSARSGRFRGTVAPMAPWIFVAPGVAFALLPSIVGADRAPEGIALTATITTLCAVAGVIAQPLARRLDAGATTNRAATIGLLVMVAGLALAALTAGEHQDWLLVPSAIVLGGAYGLCLVAGLVEVQRLAPPNALAGLTAIYYALSYLGFAAPFVLALAARRRQLHGPADHHLSPRVGDDGVCQSPVDTSPWLSTSRPLATAWRTTGSCACARPTQCYYVPVVNVTE